jgi:hypothetical protein
MPYSGNSWQQLVMGLFQVVQCRGAAIPRGVECVGAISICAICLSSSAAI